MEFLYQIHNIGIYIDNGSLDWKKKIKENIKEQFDGFEIYHGVRDIEYKLIMKDMDSIEKRTDAVVVPECSYFYEDGIMRSRYLNIAYQIWDKAVIMWTSGETWYTPYLLEIMFEKQGITFVHGASIAVDQTTGKLLLAFGGIGKTCFIANAVKKNRVTMLGDDLILVSRTGELYSYPRPFCLYEYHKALFPQYFKKHKVKYVHIENNMYVKRGIRKLKKILKIHDRNVYSFLPVSPARLFPKNKIQIEPIKLNDIYILRRNQKVKTLIISELNSAEQAANFAIDVILHEWDIGLKVILNYHAQKFVNIVDYIKPRYEILQSAFGHVSAINCVDIPEKLSATDVSRELNKIILGGVD